MPRNYTEHDTLPAFVPYVKDMPEGPIARWSGKNSPPAIGATVTVAINSIGASTVVRYFTEDGFLGVLVKPHKAPAWYVKQNGDKPCHIFGAELAP